MSIEQNPLDIQRWDGEKFVESSAKEMMAEHVGAVSDLAEENKRLRAALRKLARYRADHKEPGFCRWCEIAAGVGHDPSCPTAIALEALNES